MKNRIEVIRLCADIVSAVSTAAVSGIAIWGIFFTSLPEDLAKQFRSDIANLNDQVVELRQERRTLIQERDALTNDLEANGKKLDEIEKNRARLILEIAKLENDKKLITRALETETDSKERADAARSLIPAAIMAGVNLKGSLRGLREQIEIAIDFPKILAWQTERDALAARPPTSRDQEWTKAWSKVAAPPKAWIKRDLLNWLRDEKREMTVETYSKEITIGLGTPPITGTNLIDEFAKRLNHFPPRIQMEVDDFYKEFKMKHEKLLSEPLEVRLSPGWMPEDVHRAGIALVPIHEEVSQLLDKFYTQFDSKFLGSPPARK